jgi:alcohol dehydrogenase class IV
MQKAPATNRLTSLRADWNHPTQIRFGVGRAIELPEACRRLGMGRPLMVTDPVLARLPSCRRLVAAVRANGIEIAVFSQIPSDPDGDSIEAGTAVFCKGRHDGIVAVGGGSSLDAGKAIALAAGAGPAHLFRFVYRRGAEPPAIRKGRVPPVIAVPTTAGTGSEVNGSAVITDAAARVKKSLFHPDLLPSIVIADPALTVSRNPPLTAATGMDALSHNLEALCAPGFNPMLDGIAIQGIRFAKEWLPIAFHRQRHLQARVYTMAASMMGAIAFEKGLGAAHAMAHAVGAMFKTHHGLTVGTVLPYVLRFNRRPIRSKMKALAVSLSLARQDEQGVIDWLLSLRAALGIPETLAEIGVRPEHIPALADRTLKDANAPTNPVALDPDGVERLYRWSISGQRR